MPREELYVQAVTLLPILKYATVLVSVSTECSNPSTTHGANLLVGMHRHIEQIR